MDENFFLFLQRFKTFLALPKHGNRLVMIYSIYRKGFLAAETSTFQEAVVVVMFLKRFSLSAFYEIKDDLGNDLMKDEELPW